MKTPLLVSAALAIALGGAAVAQTMMSDDMPGMGMGEGMGMGAILGLGPLDFATLDTDGDGALTEADLEARIAARFAQADADGSGGLSATEMVAMAEIIRQEQMAARMARALSRVDDSGDGELQLDELQARAPAAVHLFDRVDADNDGAITPEEFTAAQEAMQARMGEMREERGWGWWHRDGGRHHN